MKNIKVLWMLATVFLVPSCGVMMDQYDIVHKNVGKESLNGVSISYGNFESACGFLGAGFEAHHCFANEEEAIPDQAKVEWTRVRDGKRFEKIMKVKPKLPKGRFSGDVIFLFDDDDVQLSWEND